MASRLKNVELCRIMVTLVPFEGASIRPPDPRRFRRTGEEQAPTANLIISGHFDLFQKRAVANAPVFSRER